MIRFGQLGIDINSIQKTGERMINNGVAAPPIKIGDVIDLRSAKTDAQGNPLFFNITGSVIAVDPTKGTVSIRVRSVMNADNHCVKKDDTVTFSYFLEKKDQNWIVWPAIWGGTRP
jgi:hypothetical protein